MPVGSVPLRRIAVKAQGKNLLESIGRAAPLRRVTALLSRSPLHRHFAL
jgi:hypothetical protein